MSKEPNGTASAAQLPQETIDKLIWWARANAERLHRETRGKSRVPMWLNLMLERLGAEQVPLDYEEDETVALTESLQQLVTKWRAAARSADGLNDGAWNAYAECIDDVLKAIGGE